MFPPLAKIVSIRCDPTIVPQSFWCHQSFDGSIQTTVY